MIPDPQRAVAVTLACPKTAFRTESHLRDHIAANLHLIEPGLRPYTATAVEFPCALHPWARIGSVDILAVDALDRIVVIECKVGHARPDALGQLFCYVSWARQHPAFFGRAVRGMIVANRASALLLLALDCFDSFPVTLVLVEDSRK